MRRKERLTIPGVHAEAPGQRDNGKVFVLTEMDAYTGQRWATKALSALLRVGAGVSREEAASGMAGLASIGPGSILLLPSEVLEPLKDEMLLQAQYEHKAGQPPQAIVIGPTCCVEEIPTFTHILLALVELHVGFSLAALSSILGSPKTPAA